jgi:hypothetical protein
MKELTREKLISVLEVKEQTERQGWINYLKVVDVNVIIQLL